MRTIEFVSWEAEFNPNPWWQTLAFIVFPLWIFLVGLNVVEIGLSVLEVFFHG